MYEVFVCNGSVRVSSSLLMQEGVPLSFDESASAQTLPQQPVPIRKSFSGDD